MFSVCSKVSNNTLVKRTFVRYFCKKIAKSKPSPKWPIKSMKYLGQPTSETHPHLLKNGEVVPLIQKSEFQDRRQRLTELIQISKLAEKKRHLIIVPSATKTYMSDRIPYLFRQNSDFLYLCGCQEPDSCLVITTTNSPSQHYVTLFLRDKDSHAELWDGPRTSYNDAIEFFGVNQALPISEMENYLSLFMNTNKNSTLWYDYVTPVENPIHNVIENYIKEAVNKKFESPKPFIHQLRLIKSPAEIKLMQQSCKIASTAISKTIATSKPGVSEHQLFATVDYECRMNGAEILAYPPVVAGGDRATTIHYINNNQIITDGEMILMDAGCEYHGYSSDITRTWPINGKFNEQQKLLYEAILSVQTNLIELCVGRPTLDNMFDSMCMLLGKVLQDIGLISKDAGTDLLYKSGYQFCPHHVSHYLGMDVHDTPTIPRNIKMQPGMIFTIEPGVYITNKHNVPKEFQGLAIRIEDDILITEDGPVVLTKKCPRNLSDIEKIVQTNRYR